MDECASHVTLFSTQALSLELAGERRDARCARYYISNQGKIVNICWIPSHIGIHGNNEAAKTAKSALEIEILKLKIPYADFKHFSNYYVNSLWQIFWNFCDTSKLYSIQNKVNIPYRFNLKRSDQVVISRIRIGHSKLTHTYLLKGEQQPECLYDFLSYFLECSDTLPARNLLLNNVQTMQDLFTQVNNSDILQF